MPTNREWLEHTERAAWDTVQSLRQQIEQERARVARLTPLRESWQRIIEVLDLAKTEHGITAEHYADVVDSLCAELRKCKDEREQLAYKLEAERQAARGVARTVEVVRLGEDDRPRKGGTVRWFADKIAALRTEQADRGGGLKRPNLDRLIKALEAKVDELEGAPAAEVAQIAVELGALALRAAESSDRGVARQSAVDEEEE
jgi:hypothetical protein